MAAQEAGAAPGGPGKAAPIDETLSSISTTSATITRFLRSVRAAHSHLAAVSRELSDLRLLLELMRDEQDIPLLLQAQVLALLHDCRGILARIRDMLEGGTSPAHWTSVVKPNMPSLRQSLEIFRRSLGLVLEVVHLSSLASDADATELGEVEEQIYDEVDHLRIEAALVEPIDESAMPVLLSYLDAIINCVRNSDNSSSPYSVRTRSIDTQSQAQTDTNPIPTPTSPEPPSTSSSTTSATTAIKSGLETTAIEEGLEAVSLDPKQADASQSAVISRQFETAGPWHPTQDIVLPFYSPPPQSPAPSTHSTPPQQSVHPSQSPTPTPPPPPRPGLSHSLSQPSQSPISPHTRPSQHSPQTHSPVQGVTGYPQPGHSPASSLSQQMWNQQMWRYNSNSPIMRSDSFDSRVSSAEARSATFGPEKWTEPARDFGNANPNGYTYPSSAYHSSRDPSIASIASVTSMNPPSTAPTDSPRSLFSLARHNTNNSSTSNNGHIPGPGNETPTSFNSMRSPSTASSVYSSHPTHPTPLTPTGHWNPSLYQPQPTNPILSSSSSSTSKLSLVDSINQSAGSARLQVVSQPAAYASPIDIVPTRHLTDKGKPHDVFHIDASPTSSFIATKHSNNHIKIWSVPRNSVHSNTKITSYVTPQARSREYFIRSHAILSESATLIGITTHFGFNLEIHNFSKTSSSKKLQTIDDAHRWAASRRDAYQTNYAPLVVYRPKTNQINKFFLSRHPSAKKPFWEDTSQSIDLDRANLPFVPKFPELAYSANSPFLIAAAGPRPGENNNSNMTDSSSSVGTSSSSSSNNNIILIAWQMTPVSENKLQSRSPVNSSSISTHSGNSEDLFNDGASSIYSSAASPDPYHNHNQQRYDRHRPHRFITPSYPPLQNSLPSVLVAHSTTVVSIWIPANHADIPLGLGGKFRPTPVSAPERFVLVWDIMTNATRMFGIPNVQACVSPDCRFVAYCDPGRGTPGTQGKFVIIDVASGEECWRWPARDGGLQTTRAQAQAPWASFGGQMENLSRVTVFEFSSDSRLLIVGDASGALGIYEVREAGHGPGGRYELGEMRYSPPGPPGSWSGPGGVIGELQS